MAKKKYKVSKCAYVWYSIEIEAENDEEAEELGNEILNSGGYTAEDWADWTGSDLDVEEIDTFVYVPEPDPNAEEPDVIY